MMYGLCGACGARMDSRYLDMNSLDGKTTQVDLAQVCKGERKALIMG